MKSHFHNWSDVRVFLAVVRTGSTLGASKTLAMTQPTVARRIDALEHALGLMLFDRDTRGFHPTAEALELMEPAEKIEAGVTALSEAAERAKSNGGGAIRLTAPIPAFTRRLSGLLDSFCEMHPNVRFEFFPSNAMTDIAGGEVDIAIRAAEEVEDPALICRKLAVLTGSLYGSKRYGDKHGLPASVDDLAGHKFIVFDAPGNPIKLNNWLLGRIDPDQIMMRVPDINAMFTAIEMGAGLGPLPTSQVKIQDKVIRCFAPPPETALTLWLLVNPKAYRRAEVKAFTSFFAPRYAAEMVQLENRSG